MEAEHGSSHEILLAVRSEIEDDQRKAMLRAKLWIGAQAFLILFVIGYMTWISGALSQLDAPQLTRLAAMEFEARIPELREQVRDYAIEMAPDVTDQARDLFLDIPARVRESFEEQLLARTDSLIAEFEAKLDASLSALIEDQIALVQSTSPDASPDEQLDTIVEGVSGLFRDTMIEAIDAMYVDYSREIRRLSEHLERLRRGVDLTASEEIDKELIETWMVLVHKYDVTKLESLVP